MTISGFLAEVSSSTALLTLCGLEYTGGGAGQFGRYLKHIKHANSSSGTQGLSAQHDKVLH